MAPAVRGAAYLAVAVLVGLYAAREGQVKQKLAELANTDALTGAANRRLFRERLDLALSGGTSFTLIAADVDSLKMVNDSLGHAAGDERIMGLAGALRQAIGPGGTVARVGGDEFLAITSDPVGGVAGQLIRSFGAFATASYPADASSAAELIEIADKRLYAQKRHGRHAPSIAA